jgi:hypothetical protein
MKTLALTAALLTCLAVPASAQTTGPVNSSQMDAASSNNDPRSPSDASPNSTSSDAAQNNGRAENRAAIEKIRQDLQAAGFTDVKVVARSFVVQAKSSDGSPVVMTIGPHGMSIFEAMTNDSSSNETVGSTAGRANPPGSDSSAQSTGPHNK